MRKRRRKTPPLFTQLLLCRNNFAEHLYLDQWQNGTVGFKPHRIDNPAWLLSDAADG